MKTMRHDELNVAACFPRPINRRLAATKAAAALLIVAGAGAWPVPSSAQAIVGAELRMTELERAFWICDHAATTSGIDSTTAITCGSITDTLKQRKFDGDFNALLAWWRQHKESEHLALAKIGGGTP